MPLVAFEVARDFVVRNLRPCIWRGWARFNDFPFDQAIYSENHLLHAPGACKASPHSRVLNPVELENPTMISKVRKANHMF